MFGSAVLLPRITYFFELSLFFVLFFEQPRPEHKYNQINQLCLTRVTPNSLLRLTNLWPSDSWSNWDLEMPVGFWREVKTGVQGENLSEQNKLNSQMTPIPWIEPGPHWWEASALTTAISLLHHVSVTPSAVNPRMIPFSHSNCMFHPLL